VDFDHGRMGGPQVRAVLQKEAPTIKPSVFSPKAHKVKVHKPGFRAPAVGSVGTWTSEADVRRMRSPSFLLHCCCLFFDHFFIVASLGPEPVPLI
jgi:hypothetical protein